LKVLFIGCGDIARRAANEMQNRYKCFGLKRQPYNLPKYIQPIKADATNAEQLFSVASEGFDIWIATITPGEFTEQAYKDSYLAVAQSISSAISKLPKPPRLVLWVSSTSVYGDFKGDWVNEDTTPEPNTFSGNILLAAEKIIQQIPCETSVIRFSGIYGPGRTRLLSQVLAGKGRPSSPEQWSNRVHADDCGGILAHLVEYGLSGRLLLPEYLASDSAPVTQHEIRQWLAEQLAVSLVEEEVKIGSMRRCDNSRLLSSGYQFKYPTFKEGYGNLINERKLAELAR
jgi:nucleoside-diphosphate-sugar epimerase